MICILIYARISENTQFFVFQGSQIIDVMMLVIDIVKGIQTQTAECLVIGEITCNKLIVVLNKVDMIPEAKRDQSIEKVSDRTLKYFTFHFRNLIKVYM